jgi:hypothetical protein
MKTDDPSLTLRAARTAYFADNHFGDDGGYQDTWVDFKLGPLPLPFPNTPARVRAVRYHDLHHLLTGYATDIIGEFEISAWELGAGCKDFWAAWQLNLGGLATGMWVAPRRIARAFFRGLASSSLYGLDFEPLLDRRLGELREEHGLDRPAPVTFSGALRFVAAWAAGGVAGLFSFLLLAVIGPIFYLIWRLRGAPRTHKAATARA